MRRLLHFFLDKQTDRDCGQYPDHAALFLGLQREESGAIQCLSSRISRVVYKIGRQYQLSDSDIEELLCDSVTLCLLKIKQGLYVFQGHNPATYAIEIAKNKARNYRRTALKHNTLPAEFIPVDAENDQQDPLENLEKLQALLLKLDTNCQRLIQLKYLDELSDKHVIEHQLTQYTTTDALKNKRALCLKKLVSLATAGTKTTI
jgi:RNA polymerase sigma factor (sigma-70 family)